MAVSMRVNATPDDFQALQRQFSAYLRDPENQPKPVGLDESRLAVYRNAVFSNIEQFLTDNFPRVKEFFSETDWQTLVRDYIVNHRSDTNCFVELPREFLTYLEDVREVETDPLFLYELAHFEWLETLISADERLLPSVATAGAKEFLDTIPILNPLTQLLRYSFPVHQLSPTNWPQTTPDEPTFIAAYRRRDNKFGFLEINPATARLIELLVERENATCREILIQLAEEMAAADISGIITGGKQILSRLLENEVILGTR